MATEFVQQNVDGLIWRIDTSGGIVAAVVYPLIDVPLVWNGVDAETLPALTVCTLNPGGGGSVDMTMIDYLIVATKADPTHPALVAYSDLVNLATLFTGLTYQVLAIVGKTGARDWEQG